MIVYHFSFVVAQFTRLLHAAPLSFVVAQFIAPLTHLPLSFVVAQFIAPLTHLPLSFVVAQFIAPLTHLPLSFVVAQFTRLLHAAPLSFVNDKVIFLAGWITGLAFVGFKGAVRDREMVGVDVVFSFEIECWHVEISYLISN